MFGNKTPTPEKAQPASRPSKASAEPLVSLDSSVLSGVKVDLEACLGTSTMTLETLLGLKAGEIVTLDAQLNDLVELRLNNAVIGRGELVAVGDAFGVRIVDITTTS